MTLNRPGADEPGIIGETYEDGFPVVLKLVDGPSELVNSQMLALEDALDQSLESPGLCRHAYSRTGNGLKELAYYIHERDQFMEAFNTALAEHPPCPIEITFYEDREWKDFRTIRARFTLAK